MIQLKKFIAQNFDFLPKTPKKWVFVPKITKNGNFEKIFQEKILFEKIRLKIKKVGNELHLEHDQVLWYKKTTL